MSKHTDAVEKFILSVRQATRELLKEWDGARAEDALDAAFSEARTLPPTPEPAPPQAIPAARRQAIPAGGYLIAKDAPAQPFDPGSIRGRAWSVILMHGGAIGGIDTVYRQFEHGQFGGLTAGSALGMCQKEGLIECERQIGKRFKREVK